MIVTADKAALPSSTLYTVYFGYEAGAGGSRRFIEYLPFQDHGSVTQVIEKYD